MIEHQITTEEATEILDAANVGYSVEVWLPGPIPRGLLLVNPTLEGDFEFTHWSSYAGKCEPQITIFDHPQAWLALQEYHTNGINV